MKKTKQKRLGDWGESYAVEFLEQHNYTILEQNYQTKSGEIDIIAHHNEEIVFIEVKTRSNNQFGEAAEAVDGWKLDKMRKAMHEYLVTNQIVDDVFYRIDVVVVEKDSAGKWKAEIIQDFDV